MGICGSADISKFAGDASKCVSGAADMAEKLSLKLHVKRAKSDFADSQLKMLDKEIISKIPMASMEEEIIADAPMNHFIVSYNGQELFSAEKIGGLDGNTEKLLSSIMVMIKN